jgi:hypothetical protein
MLSSGGTPGIRAWKWVVAVVPNERGGNNAREYWREKKRKYEASDLSRREFCAKEGISLSAFDYYRSVFKREEEASNGGTTPRLKKKAERVNALVPVVLADQVEPVQAIEIRTAHGHVVSIPVTVCPSVLQQVFKALGGL